MRRLARIAAAALALGAGAVLVAVVFFTQAHHDPARWHVDPLTAERTGRPNDFLVAPAGTAAAPVDLVAPVFDEAPAALFAALDTIILAEPRTERIAAEPARFFATYVQRSRVFGFPDYISVRVVAVAAGAALAIWSRSRFGYGDFGVNEARVRRWLAALERR